MKRRIRIFFSALIVAGLQGASAKVAPIPPGLPPAIDAAKPPLEFHINRKAVSVRLPDGEARMLLAGYGRASRLVRPQTATRTLAGNRVEFRRRDFTEWYVNGARGLE